MAAIGGAYFHYITYSETLKTISSKMAKRISTQFCMNVPWVDLFYISWSNFDLTKTWLPWAYFHYKTYIETLKIIFSKMA